MSEKMNIALCLNSKYVMPSVVCITSILENNTDPIDFYILYSYLTEEELSFMSEHVKKYNKESSLIAIKVDDTLFTDCPIHGRAKEAYFRLLIPLLLPKDIGRCLYLDGDTIVNKSLDEFYMTSFDGQALVVCEDLV